MANTLTGLIPVIYQALDVVSREMIGIIPAVTRDSGIERAAKGQPILIPVSTQQVASDIVPGVTPPNDGDQTFTNFTITIDNAKRVPIRWNGEEQRGLNNGGPGAQRLLVDQWAQAFRTLANMIEVDVGRKIRTAASRAAGTAGTTPFGVSGDLSDFANLNQILDDNGAPTTGRRLVLNSTSINYIRGKQSLLNKVNEAGTDNQLRRGIIDDVQGFGIGQSAGLGKQVVKGTGATLTLGAVALTGSTTLAVAGGTGTVLPGDVIQLAGDPNKYVVVASTVNNGAGSVTVGTPGLRQDHASGDAVALSSSYYANLAFAETAVVLGTRAPALPLDMQGNPVDMAIDRILVQDPVSGIAFEIATYLQYRQIQYEVSICWGAAVIKQDNVALLLG